ncbi:Kunitz/Bovine pancreatic trypsin inhibitor domain protein, partial [Opisthorchis viverrini]
TRSLDPRCNSTHFRCTSGNFQYIPYSYWCDGTLDCAGGEDERDCARPAIIDQGRVEEHRVRPGSTLVLECEASGVPPPMIIWRFNWGCLPDLDRMRTEVVPSSRGCRGSRSRLTIHNVRSGDDGIYNCEALVAGHRAMSQDYLVLLNDRCHLPIEPGPGMALLPMYAFDGNNCVPFNYGGLEGNANRFFTEAECLRVCSGQNRRQTARPRPEQPRLNDDKCSLPILSGYGSAYYRKYAFNGQRCVPFTYTGAGGNANNFYTEAECRRECEDKVATVATQTTLPTAPRPNTVDKCSLPIVSGYGTAYYRKYAFNGQRCVPFTYTGAGGNANNFYTEAECWRECESKAVN